MSQSVAAGPAVMTPELHSVLADLQSLGVRVEREALTEARSGGSGPSDAGMMWVEDIRLPSRIRAGRVQQSLQHPEGRGRLGALPAVGAPGGGDPAAEAPVLRALHRRRGSPLADRAPAPRLAGQHGHPDLHLLGQPSQCGFCGIELSLEAGQTIAVKTPAQLAEVAVAARDLDGAVDVTLTTGTMGPDRGALYVARCAEAVKEAGLPVQVQFEPPGRPVRPRPGERPRRRLDRHARRVVRSGGPGARGPGEGPQGNRGLLRCLGAGCAAVRAGTGLHVRDPRHGRGPGGDGPRLPAGHGHRRLPVHRAAAAGSRQPHGRRAAAGRRLHAPGIPEGGPLPAAAGPGVLARQGRVRALQCLLGDGGIREARGRG